jgi:hypothetical protein
MADSENDNTKYGSAQERAGSSGGMGWSRGRSAHDLRVGNGSGKSHPNRGPKNYQRSDARIYEDVCERLTLR